MRLDAHSISKPVEAQLAQSAVSHSGAGESLPVLITSHRYTEHPSVQSPDCAICGLPVGDHASAAIGGGR